jgi:ubiquinone/menaquinone biosynthesis C-methylase UbiE
MSRTFLHVGPGGKTKQQTTREFAKPAWSEVRLDIDPSVAADIEGSILDMSEVQGGSVDAVYSSHNLEHIYFHEVPLALAEFSRVLSDDGYVVLTCPDLESVCRQVSTEGLDGVLYESPAGPITALDIMYGHGRSLRAGNLFMAHKSGFSKKTLTESFISAGFTKTATAARGAPFYDLWITATKSKITDDDLRRTAGLHFPA